MSRSPRFDVRPLEDSDAKGWVECRLLSFVATSYFDDVRPAPTTFANSTIRLVSVADQSIVGLIDVEVFDSLATIDTVAVHPEWQGMGIATALLNAAVAGLPAAVTAIDAWTREDPPANAWYRRNHFAAEQHYLHVYKSWSNDSDDSLPSPPDLNIVGAFMHARLEHEAEVRRRFARVHVCCRYVRPRSA